MIFNDRRATQRALKAAQGPSLAPKGYKSDTAGRANVRAVAQTYMVAEGRKGSYAKGAETLEQKERGQR